MTDYNDGKWHLWDGGECPEHIHELSEVEYVLHNEEAGEAFLTGPMEVPNIDWSLVVRFRVTYAHVEPRELWIDMDSYKAYDQEQAQGTVLFREVLTNE